MKNFFPLREWPAAPQYEPGDVVVIFGEVFQRGYVNGIIEEAQKLGIKLIYSTVGRRDEQGQLRSLTAAELNEKQQPIVNVPLEAGFDLEPSSQGRSPVDQLQGIKLSEWQSANMNFSEVQESLRSGIASFQRRAQKYFQELEAILPKGKNVLFVHTMAGGVPRAKIIMPAMNRVFKGHGERYASSQEFWNSSMGRLCQLSFDEVTANTFQYMIEQSAGIRERVQKSGKRVAYVAYGYHGTDILMNNEYRWQSYSPYLQGFAKLKLEQIAQKNFSSGVKAQVFNAPEILTNSSSIFLGVEVALYPLIGALQKEHRDHPQVKDLVTRCEQLLKPEYKLKDILNLTHEYFTSDIIRRWSDYEGWPQHNGPEQMELMRTTSDKIIDMHRDPKALLTAELSELVFRACGKLMLTESWQPRQPVWWIGHDIIAKGFPY